MVHYIKITESLPKVTDCSTETLVEYITMLQSVGFEGIDLSEVEEGKLSETEREQKRLIVKLPLIENCEAILDEIGSLQAKGVHHIVLQEGANRVGERSLCELFGQLKQCYSNIAFALQLSFSEDWHHKVTATCQVGCDHYYSTTRACQIHSPYIPTEKLVSLLQKLQLSTHINLLAFESTYNEAKRLFG
jgi:hypothetical protein